MKLRHAIAAGSLLLALGQTALGQGPGCPPCIDRPTPPPCCADGRCLANPLYGYYPTRWRLWPVEPPATSVNQKFNPEQLQNQVPAFVTPPAEEEDRKAPPPTTPREEPGAGSRSPSAGGPNTTSPTGEGVAPPAPGGGTTLPSMPVRPPGDNSEPTGPRRTLPPYSPQAPGAGRSTGPMGESDPPPALPFGPSPMHTAQPVPTIRGPIAPNVGPPKLIAPQATGINLKSDDPPPALPGTLAGLGN